MSRFQPTSRSILPVNEPDLLADAVMSSLTRTLYFRLSWSAGQTLVSALLTIGFIPVLNMTRWLRGVIAQQEQQLWHLAEWLRLQLGDDDALELQRTADDIRFNVPLGLASVAFLCVAGGAVVQHFAVRPFEVKELFLFAFRAPRTAPAIVFAASISAAAACNWVHLAWHQQNVEKYLRHFNQFALDHEMDPVELPPLELGLRPIWICGAVLMACTGAIWGVPVMLAAAAHRRYTIGISVLTRAMLAERLRKILLARKPATRVPQPIVAARVCVRPNCRSPLSSNAVFCPRCGTRAARLMDVVA